MRAELRLRTRFVLALAALSAFTFSIHQARGSTVPVSRLAQPEVMCRQAADEQALRTWLKMESPVNKCDIKNP